MNLIILTCEKCKIRFEKYIGEYKRQIKNGRKKFYCSLRCSPKSSIRSKKERIELISKCITCKKDFKQIILKDGYNVISKCCSFKCKGKYSVTFNVGYKKSKCIECLKPIFIKNQVSNKNALCKKCRPKRNYYKRKIREPEKISVCKFCKITNLKKNHRICDDCKIKYYEQYRPACNFKFNIYHYGNFFDLKSIKKYGWYKPKNRGNNLNGISKDHILSVCDGFRMKISPLIVSHQANCKLILHKENQIKHSKSSVKLDDLIKNIKNFEKHYPSQNQKELFLELKKLDLLAEK